MVASAVFKAVIFPGIFTDISYITVSGKVVFGAKIILNVAVITF